MKMSEGFLLFELRLTPGKDPMFCTGDFKFVVGYTGKGVSSWAVGREMSGSETYGLTKRQGALRKGFCGGGVGSFCNSRKLGESTWQVGCGNPSIWK